MRLWMVLKLLVVTLVFTACSSAPTGVWQRDYVDAKYLGDGVSEEIPETEKTPRAQSTLRMIWDKDWSASLYPITKNSIFQFKSKEAFQKKWTATQLQNEIKQATELFSGKRCFDIKLTSAKKAAANLDFYYFYLDSPGRVVASLSPMKPNKTAEEEGKVSARHSPGYSMAFSYTIYSNSNIFCAPTPIDLTRGFAIFVEPRYERGLKARDAIWVTSQKEGETFTFYPGVPALDAYVELWHKANQNRIDSRLGLKTNTAE